MPRKAGLLRRFARGYKFALQTHPYKMSVFHYSFGLTLTDIFVQKCIERNKEFDKRRALSFTAVGLPMGPMTQKWVYVLEKYCPYSMTLRSAVIRMLVDQLTFSPLLLIAEIAALKYFETCDVQAVRVFMARDMKDILVANFIFWPPAMVVNFSYVPLHYRVTFMVLADFVWTSFLSWRAHLHKKTRGGVT